MGGAFEFGWRVGTLCIFLAWRALKRGRQRFGLTTTTSTSTTTSPTSTTKVLLFEARMVGRHGLEMIRTGGRRKEFEGSGRERGRRDPWLDLNKQHRTTPSRPGRRHNPRLSTVTTAANTARRRRGHVLRGVWLLVLAFGLLAAARASARRRAIAHISGAYNKQVEATDLPLADQNAWEVGQRPRCCRRRRPLGFSQFDLTEPLLFFLSLSLILQLWVNGLYAWYIPWCVLRCVRGVGGGLGCLVSKLIYYYWLRRLNSSSCVYIASVLTPFFVSRRWHRGGQVGGR